MNSLHQLYTLGGMIKPSSNGKGIDGLKGSVVVRKDSTIGEKKVAVNLCGRLGHESIALDFPIISFKDELETNENNIYIEIDEELELVDDDECIIFLSKENKKNVYIIAKNEKSLESGGQYLYGRLPYVWKVGEGELKLQDIEKDFLSIEGVENCCINELYVHSGQDGIWKLVLDIEAKDREKVKEYIKNNKKRFRYDYIKKIEILLSNDVETISIKHRSCNEVAKNKMEDKHNEPNSLDLTNIFTIEGIFKDTDNDFLPDEIDSKIIISEKADDYELIAAGNIAGKLGLECLGIEFPIIFTEEEYNEKINNPMFVGDTGKAKKYIENIDEAGIKVIKEKDNNLILLIGKGEKLIKAAELVSTKLPYINKNETIELVDLKNEIRDLIGMKSFEGQLISLDKALEETKGQSARLFFDLEESNGFCEDKIKEYFSKEYNIEKIDVQSYKTKENIFQKEYDIPWEVDKFKDVLERNLYPNLKADDKVVIYGRLSEEKSVREKLEKEISDNINKYGAILNDCEILCSYKQGLSWIMERVVPDIKEEFGYEINSIKIFFRPYLPEGKVRWDDTDGATPNINEPRKDNPDKWFDLPIRLVQELYPVDDLISSELGINRDNIEFEMMESNKNNKDYEIVVYDKDNNILYKEDFRVKHSERPYLDEYPGIGKVHPNTGWITVLLNGKKVIDENIETDLEKVWNIYQRETLKETKDFILDSTDGKPTENKQPFFNQLRIDVEISEPDYKLDVRKDLITTLDALHEDIYFVGLDFFKTFGTRSVGDALDEPGLILPVVNKRNGQAGRMKTTLSVEKYKSPVFYIDNTKYDVISDVNYTIDIKKITFKDKCIDNIYMDIFVEEEFSKVKDLIDRYSKLLKEEVIAVQEGLDFNNIIINVYDDKGNKECCEINSKKDCNSKNCNESISIEDIEVPMDEVIGYDEYINIIEQLKKVDGIKVWKASHSYQGRDIYAIDIAKQFDSQVVSQAKLINSRPVYFINNRHHANEVSSTNSAFLLVKKLLTDGEYKKYLEDISITLIPFENVDGGYIHYELQKDNPEWKLHVARFNSVGKEFAREYFNEDTKYPESKALPRVWRRWLPDMLVDNHGVPSHEWDQQFSGYVSPWFKGFWLPRALFYGYFWYIDSPEYPKHKGLNEAIQFEVSKWMNKDKEISEWNADWKNRFEKYAHSWMPKLFPANYYENLIYYWIPYRPNKDSWHASHRYPWITAVDWTTEVSDETAQGEYLELCVRAHHIGDLAVIDMLSKAGINMMDLSRETFDCIQLKKVRQRPLTIKK